MALSAALAFSYATPRELIVLPIVNFWNAPSLPRNCETCLIARSTIFCAVTRLLLVRFAGPPLDSADKYPRLLLPRDPVETDWMPRDALSVSVTFDTSEKVAP